MPSLSQILRDFSPLLLVDAASERVQAGLLGVPGGPRWSVRKEEAGVGLFQCLDELNVDIASVGAFAFCSGPGSILGIRTTAMAVRMWTVLTPRPVFGYSGLAVVAEALGRADVALIADARRGLWHRQVRGGSLERVPAGALSGELIMPAGFRHWDPLPPGATETPYDMASLLAQTAVTAADLFREEASPDAFLHEEPSYAVWTPRIHRAP